MDVGSDLLDFYVVRAGSCEARDNSLELVIKGDVAIDFGPQRASTWQGLKATGLNRDVKVCGTTFWL
jgi:hypothetical protein